jgi:hypothetical protein
MAPEKPSFAEILASSTIAIERKTRRSCRPASFNRVAHAAPDILLTASSSCASNKIPRMQLFTFWKQFSFGRQVACVVSQDAAASGDQFRRGT